MLLLILVVNVQDRHSFLDHDYDLNNGHEDDVVNYYNIVLVTIIMIIKIVRRAMFSPAEGRVQKRRKISPAYCGPVH